MQYPTHFIANSDYPFDMIIYYKYVEITPNGGAERAFAHNLGFSPLLFGSWSETEDFESAYPLGRYVFAASDGTNVYIRSPGSTWTKRYVKIYGYAPLSWTGECKPTAQSNTALLLDTDNEYSPLLAAGEVQPRRMDNPDTPGEQTGIAETIGKTGYVEITGRSSSVNLYYYEPLAPMAMLWKTTASTGRTELATTTALYDNLYPMRVAPYAMYHDNTGIVGRWALEIFAGTTRTGMANYNDIVHFRVYG